MIQDRENEINELKALLNKKDFAGLIKASNNILDKDNSSATVWNFLALGYRYNGDVAKSLTIYERILHSNPNNFLINANAGHLFLNLGRVQDAIDCFKEALSVEPNNAEICFSLALAQIDTGQSKDAKSNLKIVLELEPNNESARYQLGRLLQLEKDYRSAANEFEKINYKLSKTHQLECLYMLGDKTTYFKNFSQLVKNSSPNPLMATIACHASIRFSKDHNNPFCSKPMDYVLHKKLEHIDYTKKLIADLIEIKSGTESRHQPLLQNGNQSSGNLFLKNNPQIEKLKKILLENINEYRNIFSNSEEGFIKDWPKNFSLYGWLVSIKKGGKLKAHIHKDGWLSGSIYLKMPKRNSSNEGNILFDLAGPDYPDGGKQFPEQEFEISEGNLVLFPSSLYHQTIPFSSNEERISFAFDVFPMG